MKKISLKKIWNYQFWPVNLMKDCSQGNPIERYMAYQYNQTRIYLLQIPILNWIIFAIGSYTGLILCEWLGKTLYPFAIYMAALCGISLAVSVIPCLVLSISYVFLKNVDIKISEY